MSGMRRSPNGLLMGTARVLLPNTVSNPRLHHQSSQTLFLLLSPLGLPQRFGPPLFFSGTNLTLTCRNLAEFRGPGVHHNFDDSDSGYDVDSDNKPGKSFGIGGHKGRIIFLGDGTEILTDSDDTEMFDNSEEDQDLASQVSKSSGSGSEATAAEEGAGAETGGVGQQDKQPSGEAARSETNQPETAAAGSGSPPESRSDEGKDSGEAKKEK